jgi:SAM-dependent methyltransferase
MVSIAWNLNYDSPIGVNGCGSRAFIQFRRSMVTDPATVYEEWFVPAVFAPMARLVLGQTEIAPDARILDIACGSGIVARTAAARLGAGGQVVGLDQNLAMLEVARRKSAAQGLDVEWRQGNAQELPFDNGTFDLVLCQHGLQFFPDRIGAVAEMYRVLAPEGRVAVVTWRGLDEHPFPAALGRVVRNRFDSPAFELPFSLGDPAELGSLLLEAGFANVSVEPADIMADYSEAEQYIELQVNASAAGIRSLQGLPADERDAIIAAIRDDMAEPVRAVTVDGRIRFPMKGIVARGVHP